MRHFIKGRSPLDRPLILLVDEFDKLPAPLIEQLVSLFRDLYLTRQTSLLHSLALVGVRAVMGVEMQRSLHVPNLTRDEVTELFAQYQEESGQLIEAEVVARAYEATRGQPGLVGWFGELLTEKYNPDRGRPITLKDWSGVYGAACQVEPNNTVLNLLSKARGEYEDRVMTLFARANVPFAFDQPWCNYLYMHGIIDHEDTVTPMGEVLRVCRFSSPFVQERLYHAFSADRMPGRRGVPMLDLRDDLADVFLPGGLDVPALLRRYRDYLLRLRKAGIDPWKDQPRRTDLHITEAVGHFDLYAWLREAISDQCTISPEFPTGNGKVDLVLHYQGGFSLIEIKSLEKRHRLKAYRRQVAEYARKKGFSVATLAVFVPVYDEELLKELSGVEVVNGVEVTTVVFG